MPTTDSLGQNGEQVRRLDHDRYLTCLFAPAPRRAGLFALYAFNIEVAKTREVVSQPLLGQIRLQWWRDAIGEIYDGRPRRHEVLDALAPAIWAYDLSRAHFDTVLDARERDLEDEPPATLADLERYAADTAGPLLRLHLEVLGVREDAAHRAATAVGTAWALVGLMRALPFHARQKRLYLPQEIIAAAGVDRGLLFEMKPHDGLRRAAARVAEAARERLAEARALRHEVPRTAVPALLSARLADGYLRRLRRAGHDVFSALVQEPPPLRQADLVLGAILGRY
ncbi:NADH dehydrogenase [ubiquinone] 1 alpha subcomplex assembly factor 6 [Inquilinus ginsengisoli]|uniref:phytoene/squalene synthase family protein n=1 Tax=Inquilinus ginsengisoli TaxID=363840 RepID=UPI003D1C0BA9